MFGLSRSRSPTITPTITNVMSKLNTIKANINSLKNQPKTVNSSKNEKIKYLNDQIKEKNSLSDSLVSIMSDIQSKLKEQGKTNDEIKTDEQFLSSYHMMRKISLEIEALEEQKRALVMSGGKTRRNKRKNRKTRKSN
jgi:uncharacterized protein YfkK (UPF0435 family)